MLMNDQMYKAIDEQMDGKSNSISRHAKNMCDKNGSYFPGTL